MTDHKIVLVDAHRGASVSFPENTLAAFEAGVAAGADSVEFDVQLSADGVAVVIHDDTVDRTTNGTGAVSELTLAELQSLDAGSWKAPSFAGEKIPSLDEALTLLTKYVRINMELKSADPRLAERAIEAIERHGVHRRLMASSFHLQHLLTIKERLPEVQTNYLLEKQLPAGFWQADGRKIDSIGLHWEHASAAVIADLREHGRPTRVWTVDDPLQALRLAAMGVESITTNDPIGILLILGGGGYRGPVGPADG